MSQAAEIAWNALFMSLFWCLCEHAKYVWSAGQFHCAYPEEQNIWLGALGDSCPGYPNHLDLSMAWSSELSVYRGLSKTEPSQEIARKFPQESPRAATEKEKLRIEAKSSAHVCAVWKASVLKSMWQMANQQRFYIMKHNWLLMWENTCLYNGKWQVFLTACYCGFLTQQLAQVITQWTIHVETFP